MKALAVMSDKESAVAEHTDIEIEVLFATLDPAEKPELIDFGPPVGREIWPLDAELLGLEIPRKNGWPQK